MTTCSGNDSNKRASAFDMVSTAPVKQHTCFSAGPATPASRNNNPQELPSREKKRLNGTWTDGRWWCNCEPRRQAALLQVKKAGPNKGKFFWTCATRPSCDLFLWNDDAAIRVAGLSGTEVNPRHDFAVYDDGHESEQPQRPKTPSFIQHPLELFGIQRSPSRRPAIRKCAAVDGKETDSANVSFDSTPIVRDQASASGTGSAGPTTPYSPKKRRIHECPDQDDNFSDLNSDDERKLAEITDKSATKAALKSTNNNTFATPSTSRRTTDMIAGLPTPSVSRTLFPASDVRKPKTVSIEPPIASATLMTPSRTSVPTPEASSVTPSNTANESIQDLNDQVMDLLRDQKVDANILYKIQGLLDTASRRTRGLVKSRDATRTALQKKEHKVLQLSDKIRDLEDRAKLDHESRTETKRQLMAMYKDI